MEITALVENQTNCELIAKHGLSLYIQTQKHKILFDLGPDGTIFKNAKLRGIDLTEVDTVIISHGHNDHGGALNQFLQMNSTAKVYVQRKAFEPHFSKLAFLKIKIGIEQKLQSHPQIVLVDGDYQINEELRLFTVNKTKCCYSHANDALYDGYGKDSFSHEHSLIIEENQTALIMGCGHTGIVNVLEQAKKYHPQICVGGYHLFNPVSKKTVSDSLLDKIALEMQCYPTMRFYTCHCTGTKAFQYLSKQVPNLFYLSCGETVKSEEMI